MIRIQFIHTYKDIISLENILMAWKEFLENKLKLNMHLDKVYIKIFYSGVDFLGWVNFPNHRVLRTATKKRMFRNTKNNPKKEVIQSYLGILSHGNGHKLEEIVKHFYQIKIIFIW